MSLLKSGEWRYIKAINNNNIKSHLNAEITGSGGDSVATDI